MWAGEKAKETSGLHLPPTKRKSAKPSDNEKFDDRRQHDAGKKKPKHQKQKQRAIVRKHKKGEKHPRGFICDC